VLAETIEELVWQAVSELLRNPQVLIEQYNQRQESGYGTPEQQEQQRLKRRMAGLEREGQRLIDAYQSGVIDLDDLKERRERIAEECRRLEERLNSLEQQKQGQQRQAALTTTVEEFCRNISAALDNPSFETKQKILRLVVERVEFVEDQITIKHVIPISDVRLQRDQHSPGTPKWFLWHGNVYRALEVIEDLECQLESIEGSSEKQRKLLKAVKEFSNYIGANKTFIPNYGDRYHHGETISTALVESTVNYVVSKRMVKKQQMRWSERGAHLLLQVRTQVLNEDLRNTFCRWYPGMQNLSGDAELKEAA